MTIPKLPPDHPIFEEGPRLVLVQRFNPPVSDAPANLTFCIHPQELTSLELCEVAGLRGDENIENWIQREVEVVPLLRALSSVRIGPESPDPGDLPLQAVVLNQAEFRTELRRWFLLNHARWRSKHQPEDAPVRCVIVSVEWGYLWHDCPMSLRTWERVLRGRQVFRREPYWYEGERFSGEWYFNCKSPGSLYVGFDGGGVGFDGKLEDAEITVDGHDWSVPC